MDISKIRADLAVYAEGPGGLDGASDVHFGTVDGVEAGKYIKLKKLDSPDGQHHWFPINWVRAVDESAVFLNKTVDQALADLMNEAPSEG
ncbi:MAG: DUF2171 domain-containing protein [Plectolyngbya sp. WJT66-NPBG17]|jgi:hypothetical protein|nr:DUF2171 domain-containing protein [Plectolyngbya sp. WJT66-NPBG17]MBW4524033.1 DUF2171 domain-containing protein [Phormidium tanganyikae FI6-MK23]